MKKVVLFLVVLLTVCFLAVSAGAQEFAVDPRKPLVEDDVNADRETVKGKYGKEAYANLALVESTLLPGRTLLQQRNYGKDLFIAGWVVQVVGAIATGLSPVIAGAAFPAAQTCYFGYEYNRGCSYTEYFSTYASGVTVGSLTMATGMGLWIAGAAYWNNANREMNDIEQYNITQSQREQNTIRDDPFGNLVRGKHGGFVGADIALIQSTLLPGRTLLEQRDYGIDLFITGMVLQVAGGLVAGLSPLGGGGGVVIMAPIGGAVAATGLGLWIAGAAYWGNASGNITAAERYNLLRGQQSKATKDVPVTVSFFGTGLGIRY